MYNYIKLSCYLFGPFYIFYKSFELINKSLLEKRKYPYTLFLMNWGTFIISGSIYIYILERIFMNIISNSFMKKPSIIFKNLI
jgi:hypothetical protein